MNNLFTNKELIIDNLNTIKIYLERGDIKKVKMLVNILNDNIKRYEQSVIDSNKHN